VTGISNNNGRACIGEPTLAAPLESLPSAFLNGCHIAEVEIDPETGLMSVVKYSMVNAFGVIVNRLLVEGQAHGGVVQGIGQHSWSALSSRGRPVPHRLFYGLRAAACFRCGPF
jgi:CO/xanthine dehydrogenase Mo-binding subunit